MNDNIKFEIRKMENFLGFAIRKTEVPLELNESHDETLSYALCQRFYGKNNELKRAIAIANETLARLLSEFRENNDKAYLKDIQAFHALIGNMYYLFGNFRLSAGYFMKCLSYNKNDITPWIELLFSLRAMGKFDFFERAIFNFEKIYLLWKKDPETKMTQEKFYELINKVRCRIP